MTSTTTVTELCRKIFSPELTRKIEEIDLIVISDFDASSSVDELAERFLSERINKDIPKIDAQEESLTVDFETQHKRFNFRAKGKWLLIVVITVASSLIGVDITLSIIRLIFGR